MLVSLRTVTYVVASMLFILSLRGLSSPVTSRRGNLYGAVGMALAIAMTALVLVFPRASLSTPEPMTTGLGLLAATAGAGAVIGAVLAARVAMTSMPELVAMLHSFVGAAAVLVGFASYLGTRPEGSLATLHDVEVFVGVFIGAITFTGSVIAFLKLRAIIGGRPLLLPGRHFLNAAVVVGSAVLMQRFLAAPTTAQGLVPLGIMTGLALLLGLHLVLGIGGGDMPVVVSLLNSYSGWAAAAAGFMLSNDLLIITGALVGSSGAILSAIMCRAMNRSIWNVVFGGFGQVRTGTTRHEAHKPVHETTAEQTALLLAGSKNVIIVPGYGMAVAQAQHVVRAITEKLQQQGVNVTYAIHPVAGRLPGHMNVLLAEANVPYDIVKEMDEVNGSFAATDVAMIIGANDIVNPGALTDKDSPIYGMPVLQAWKAGKVIMLKRSMNAGYAGVDNDLCYRDNTLMLFGDAKTSVQKISDALSS